MPIKNNIAIPPAETIIRGAKITRKGPTALAHYRAASSAIDYNAQQKAHRWVLSEAGLWSLGCDCFAFLGLDR